MQQDTSRPATGYPYPNPPPQSAAAAVNGYPPPPGAAAVNGYPPPPGAVNGYPPPGPGVGGYPFHYMPPYTNPRAALYRRLFIIFMACLLLMGVALFVVFLVVRPRLPDVTINSLSVSGFNVTNSMVSGRWDFQFQVRNPNSKMSLYYDKVDCTVYYRRASLSESHLPPFDLGPKDQTTINGSLSVASNYLEGRLVDSIGKERAASGRVEFDVQAFSLVGFRYGLIRRRRFVSFFCKDVNVGLPANSDSGKMMGPAKECEVY